MGVRISSASLVNRSLLWRKLLTWLETLTARLICRVLQLLLEALDGQEQLWLELRHTACNRHTRGEPASLQ